MIAEIFKSFGRMLKSLWRGLTVLRQVFANLLFLAVLVFLLTFFAGDQGQKVPSSAALILSLEGSVVEQSTARILPGEAFGQPVRTETLLEDILRTVDNARTDPRIKLMVLDLEHLSGGGISKLKTVGAALKEFRESGKSIYAHGTVFTQQQYYLAAHADRLYLDPLGTVLLTGYGVYRNYYKSLLDKLDVSMHVFTVGTFKSAMEPFLRDDMSAPARAANLAWLGDLWHAYRSDLAGLRQIKAEDIDGYIDRFAELLADAGGDGARLALSRGLVDGLKTANELEEDLAALVGRDEERQTFNRIRYEDYLAAIGPRPQVVGSSRNQIGVIVASGIILDGEQPAGRIGGDSLSALIRGARTNPDIKALVLRLDTNGGSSFASEVIRRELESTRLAGKPVVVSMGSAAASGGYWIATAADEIWALPTTLTGSIGIFGAFVTFEETLAKLGVHNDGVGTNRISDAFIPSRALNPQLKAAIQQMTERGYRLFLERVAEGRDMAPAAVEKIAEGRVWSGSRARELGLVDQLGDLEEAVKSAAKLAGFDDYSVASLDHPPTARERLIRHLTRLIAGQSRSSGPPASGISLLQKIWTDLTPLQQLNDPNGVYAYCLPCRSE